MGHRANCDVAIRPEPAVAGRLLERFGNVANEDWSSAYTSTLLNVIPIEKRVSSSDTSANVV